MTKSKFKLIAVIVVVLFISYKVISFFSIFHFYAAGTYPYAETYYIRCSEKKILDVLEKMNLTNLDLKDQDTTDYWHNIYFDLHGKRIETWTRPSVDDGTDFALVAVHESRKTGWQLVNQELGLFKNIMVKREFEKEIVNKLKAELEK